MSTHPWSPGIIALTVLHLHHLHIVRHTGTGFVHIIVRQRYHRPGTRCFPAGGQQRKGSRVLLATITTGSNGGGSRILANLIERAPTATIETSSKDWTFCVNSKGYDSTLKGFKNSILTGTGRKATIGFQSHPHTKTCSDYLTMCHNHIGLTLIAEQR